MKKIISRDIEKEITKWLNSKEIIAIRGVRQCGKTTFLERIKEILQERGIDRKNIHFISFEDDIEKEKFEKNPKDYLKYFMPDNGKKHFFLLDEVQYIKKAGKILKLIYDETKNIKIIITGSSTLDLNEMSSYLVGRVLLFEMYPFSFNEFLKARDEKLFNYYSNKKINLFKPSITEEALIFLEELNILLKEYIIFGGYPAVVLEKNIEKKKFLLRNIFLTYIEKDIVKVYGLKYRQRISDLVRQLSSLNSCILNYNELASLTGLYNKEIKEILAILEDTYIIKLIKPFHKNLTTELRKNPQIYFIDTGLRNFIIGRFEFGDEEYGKLFENYILSKLRQEKINYWRTTAKAEVDFVVDEKIPIEVKMRPKITRAFRSFLYSYNPKFAFIANNKEQYRKRIEKTNIFVVPFAII